MFLSDTAKMDSANVCRSCLARDATVEVSTEYDGVTLSALLVLSAGISADESEALPRCVCVACRALLVRFHEFRERARSADAAIRRHLAAGRPLQDCNGYPNDFECSEAIAVDPPNQQSTQFTPHNEKEDRHKKGKKGKQKKCPPWKKQDVSITDNVLGERPASPMDGDDSDMEISLSTLSSKVASHRQESREDGSQVEPKDSHLLSEWRKERRRGARWVCEACGYRAADRCSLRVHRRFHTGERPFQCPHCSKAFAISANLKAHARVHSGERPFVCEWCGRALSTAASLRGHMRVHTGERPFACGACPRTFALRSNLRQHARVHSGERPYACETCGKRSSSSSDARAHRRTHTGERPHACAACPRRFALASNLRAHRRTHAAASPSTPTPTAADHVCRRCGQRFTLRSELSSHARSHRKRRGAREAAGAGAGGAARHACEVCGKSFARKSNLAAHKRKQKACCGATVVRPTSVKALLAADPAPTDHQPAPLAQTNRTIVLHGQQFTTEGKVPVTVGQPPRATLALMQIGGGALVCAAPLPSGAITLVPVSILR